MAQNVRSRFLAVGFLVLVLGLGGMLVYSHAAGGGEPARPGVAAEAPNLKLIKTWIQTNRAGLSLTTAWVDAFVPTAVACPGSARSCTLRIEVSSLLWGVDPGFGARMRVTVNGSEEGVEPNPTAIVSSNTSSSADAVTFAWMVQGITAGTNPIVDVEFGVSSGTASAGYRTLTIGVYKP